jgi:anaerobic ribonucleoside-triphosphate reductase activating protein
MNYASIKTHDVANGPGVRVSIFVSGCTHRCKGCFNSVAWDFDYGKPYTEDETALILDAADHYYIKGLSLLGGEPMEPQNQPTVYELVRQFKTRYPDKTVWCYSGYTLEGDLWREGSRARCSHTDEMLSLIDVLVDGPFVQERKNLSLRFRGSDNQRILHLPASLAARRAVLWEEEGPTHPDKPEEDVP